MRVVSALLFLLLFCSQAHSALRFIDERDLFVQAGTLVSENGFDEYTERYTPLGQSWTAQGVKYESDFNVIIGAYDDGRVVTSHNPLSAVFTDGVWGSITGIINTPLLTIHRLGFDLGFVSQETSTRTTKYDITVDVRTNLSSYSYRFAGAELIHPALGATFVGFASSLANEYITRFMVTPSSELISPTLDNVILINGPAVVQPISSPTVVQGSSNTASQPVNAPASLLLIVLGWVLVSRRAIFRR